MRWFKHLSLSHNEKALSSLLDKFGAAGYGIFWIIVEKIALLMEDGTSLPEATYSLKTWASFCRTSQQKFNSVAALLEQCGEFELLVCKEFNKNSMTIKYTKLLKYKDEWTQRKGKNSGVTRELLGSYSGVTPDQRIDIDKDKDINIDINIKPTVTSRAPALYAINDDQSKLVPIGTPSGRRELLECLEQNFSPETIVNGMKANGKLLHMLDVWEASGVTREDVEAEILHVRTFRPDAEITSPIYYLKGVLQKANERKTKGGYRNAKSGSNKLTIKQKIDIARSKLK